ncbi:MAG: sulfate/molybdate ABC transporter ATP-binding protein, partial [Selenomonadaceae bacterium]
SKPELLLLDEPLTALDAYLKSQVEAELAVVLQKYSRTTLFVSHSRDEIYRFCDKIAVLADGALEPVRLKAEVFKNPQTLAASRLTGCKNHSRLAVGRPGKVTALDWGGIELVASCDLPAPYAGIRAHDITLAENLCEDNTYEFEVVRVIEEVFSFVLLMRRPGFAGEELRVEGPKEVWQEYAIAGKRAYLKLPPKKIFFLYA